MTTLKQLENLEIKLMQRHPLVRDRLRVFLAGYLDAIVEHHDSGLKIEDFSLEALAYCAFDCSRFMIRNADDIGLMLPQAGYDFGSMRSGEYANTFSRWPEASRMRLSVATFAFGPLELDIQNGEFVYKVNQ